MRNTVVVRKITVDLKCGERQLKISVNSVLLIDSVGLFHFR